MMKTTQGVSVIVCGITDSQHITPLTPLAGRALARHAIDLARSLDPTDVLLLLGDEVIPLIPTGADVSVFAVDLSQPLVTNISEALKACLSDHVLLLPVNVPCLRKETLISLCAEVGNARTLTKCQNGLPDGPLVERTEGGTHLKTVSPAQPEQGAHEMLVGPVFASKGQLSLLTSTPSGQRDFHSMLSDILQDPPLDVSPYQLTEASVQEGLVCHSLQDLSCAESVTRAMHTRELQDQGVQIIDPKRVYIEGTVVAGTDCIIDVDVVLKGYVRLGDRVTIGPGTVLQDTVVGNDVHTGNRLYATSSVLHDRSTYKNDCSVQNGSVVKEDVVMGTRPDITNTTIGARCKMVHLSSLTDAVIGSNVNLSGAMSFSSAKSTGSRQYLVGDDSFLATFATGACPVTVGSGSFVAAGTVVTEDVPPDVLFVKRNRGSAAPIEDEA